MSLEHISINSFESLVSIFKDQLSNSDNPKKLFWRDCPPVNYVSGELLNGISFLLCGLNSYNQLENRWIAVSQLNDCNLSLQPNEPKQKSIVFIKNDEKFCNVGSIEFVNLVCVDNYNTIPAKAVFYIKNEYDVSSDDPTKEIFEISKKSNISKDFTDVAFDLKVPFENSNDQISFYDYHDLSANQVISAFKSKCLNYYHLITQHHQVFGTKDYLYVNLTLDIALSRIAYREHIYFAEDDDYFSLINQLKNLPNESYGDFLKFAQCFSLASQIENLMFNNPRKDLDAVFDIPKETEPFLTTENYIELLNNTNEEQFNVFIDNLKLCYKAEQDEQVYLHFYNNDYHLESCDFFVTNIDLISQQMNGYACFNMFDQNLHLYPFSISFSSIRDDFSANTNFKPLKTQDFLNANYYMNE